MLTDSPGVGVDVQTRSDHLIPGVKLW